MVEHIEGSLTSGVSLKVAGAESEQQNWDGRFSRATGVRIRRSDRHDFINAFVVETIPEKGLNYTTRELTVQRPRRSHSSRPGRSQNPLVHVTITPPERRAVKAVLGVEQGPTAHSSLTIRSSRSTDWCGNGPRSRERRVVAGRSSKLWSGGEPKPLSGEICFRYPTVDSYVIRNVTARLRKVTG